MPDGKIVIEAAIETAGMKKGSREIEASFRDTASKLQDLNARQQVAAAKSIQAFARQNRMYREQEARVEGLKQRVQELTDVQTETVDFRSTKEDIDKIIQQLSAATEKRDRLLQAGSAPNSGAVSRVREEIRRLQEELAAANRAKEELLSTGAAYETNGDLARVTDQLAAAEARLAEMGQNLEISYASTAAGLEDYADAASTASSATADFGRSVSSGVKKLLTYGIGIRSTYMLFSRFRSAIKEGFDNLANTDRRTAESIQNINSALSTQKTAVAAAFLPVLSIAVPALNRLTGVVITASNALANFFAILGGKSTYKKLTAEQNDYADSLEATGGAAKKAERQLSGLDEMARWQEDSGGGGGGAGAGLGSLFEDVATDLDTFGGRFALNVKDVLFKWDGLNGEEIAKKVIAGIGLVLGAATGFALGGVPGAIVGAIAGVALSLLIDTMTFDNDGHIGRQELATMLAYAAAAITGGVIGFFVGGVKGALLGASLGVSLAMLIQSIAFTRQQRMKDAFYASEVGQELRALQEELAGYQDFVAEVRLSVKTRQDAVTNLQKVEKAADKIVERIVDLQRKADLSNAEIMEMNGLMAELDAMGLDGLRDSYEEATGRINLTESAIRAVIAAQMAQARADAYMENYLQALRDQASVEWQIERAKQAQKAAQDDVNALQDYHNELLAMQEAYNANNIDLVLEYIDKLGLAERGAFSIDELLAESNLALKEANGTLTDAIKTTTDLEGQYAEVTAETEHWHETATRALADLEGREIKPTVTPVVSDDPVSLDLNGNVIGIRDQAPAGDHTVDMTGEVKRANVDPHLNLHVPNATAYITDAVDKLPQAKRSLKMTAELSALKGNTQLRIVQAYTGGILQNGKWHIPGYASGTLKAAQIFAARENGIPEMVGRIGSSTAVLNNGQIVASVAQGVYQAVAAAFGRLSHVFGAMAASSAAIPAALNAAAARLPHFTLPMPVMVTGTVIPPAAQLRSSEAQEIKTALQEIRALLGRAPQSGGGATYHFVANLEGRTLFEEVLTQARFSRDANGRNPFDME